MAYYNIVSGDMAHRNNWGGTPSGFPDVRTAFQDLAQWYLELPKALGKKSYDRDKRSLVHLQPYLGKRLLKDITPAYQPRGRWCI